MLVLQIPVQDAYSPAHCAIIMSSSITKPTAGTIFRGIDQIGYIPLHRPTAGVIQTGLFFTIDCLEP